MSAPSQCNSPMYVNAPGISAPADGTYPYDAVQAAALLAQAETAARRQDAAQLLRCSPCKQLGDVAPGIWSHALLDLVQSGTLREPRLGQDAAQLLTTLREPRPLASAAAAARDGCCRGIGPWLRGQRCTHPVDPGTAALARPLCARCREQRAAAARRHRRRAAGAAAPGRKPRNRAAARDTCVGCGGANAWPAHLQHPRTSRCHPCFAAQRRTTRAPSSAAARAARRAFQG